MGGFRRLDAEGHLGSETIEPLHHILMLLGGDHILLHPSAGRYKEEQAPQDSSQFFHLVSNVR
ncbi:hypothetical protein D3C85_1708330 [compost metagenome]